MQDNLIDINRDAVVTRVVQILKDTSPKFDFSGIGNVLMEAGLSTKREAEKIALYGEFPDWLVASISSDYEAVRADNVATSSEILPRVEQNLSAAKRANVVNDLVNSFQPATMSSPSMKRITGGASTHYVQNFRQVAWTEQGIIEDLSTANGAMLPNFLREAAPRVLPGHTFLGVVEGSIVYTHWLLDTLPRLLLLADDGRDFSEFDTFLFATVQNKFHKDTLRDFGITMDRVVTRQHGGDLFHVESFTHVTAPRVEFVTHPRVYDMVSSFFGAAQVGHKKQDLRLFVSRAKAGRRRILNEDDIMQVLEPLGFQAVCLEDLSIPQTAELMARASHIIAPHGAGLANLVFAQSGTKVLELFNAHLSREYWVISNHKKLDYHAFEVHGPDNAYLDAPARNALSFMERNGMDLSVPIPEFSSYVQDVFL